MSPLIFFLCFIDPVPCWTPTVTLPELLQTSAETGAWLKPTVVLALSIGAVLALLLAAVAGLIVSRRRERRPFVAPELTRSGALKLGRASDGNVKFLLDTTGQPVLLGKGTSSEVSPVCVLGNLPPMIVGIYINPDYAVAGVLIVRVMVESHAFLHLWAHPGLIEIFSYVMDPGHAGTCRCIRHGGMETL